jgi:DNA-directed RNA polymerase subunit RPC12/RpoP
MNMATKTKTRKLKKNKADGKLRCGLCGKTEKLTKTECCGQWICDNEDKYVLFSYATNSCYRNHRRYTLCGYHHAEEHAGNWKDCPKCRNGFETEMYVYYGTNEFNSQKLENPPAYLPTRCAKCGVMILLGYDSYSKKEGEYRCEECTHKEMGGIALGKISKLG